MPRRRLTARARSWWSVSPKMPICLGLCASTCGDSGRAHVANGEGKREGRGRKFSRLFRLRRAARSMPVASRPGVVPRANEDVLTLKFEPDDDAQAPAAGQRCTSSASPGNSVSRIAAAPADVWLLETVRWAWRTRRCICISQSICMRPARSRRERGHPCFRPQSRDLLLAAPAGMRATIGLDPGFRTGVKVAVVDATGKVRP